MCVSERERERERENAFKNVCKNRTKTHTPTTPSCEEHLYARNKRRQWRLRTPIVHALFCSCVFLSLSTDGGENTKLDTQTHFPVTLPALRGNVSLCLVLNKRKTRIVPRRRGPAKNQATATREHVSARARALVPRCLIRLQTKGKRSTHTHVYEH